MIQSELGEVSSQPATTEFTWHAGVRDCHDVVVQCVVQHAAVALDQELKTATGFVVLDIVHELDPTIKSAQRQSIETRPTAQLPHRPTIGQRTLMGMVVGSTWASSLFEL